MSPLPFSAHNTRVELNDPELLSLVREGDDVALEVMIDRYRGFARSKAKTYFLPGADREDVVQEGMIGLFKAIRDYDVTKGPFSCFAELCVTRQIHTAIKHANRHKHRTLSGALSLEAHPPSSPEDSLTLYESLPDVGPDIADGVASADAVDRLRHELTDMLTALEQEVLRLYIEGRSYREMAEWLGSSLKSIDNALQRVKMKLDRHFNPSEVFLGP